MSKYTRTGEEAAAGPSIVLLLLRLLRLLSLSQLPPPRSTEAPVSFFVPTSVSSSSPFVFSSGGGRIEAQYCGVKLVVSNPTR